MINEHYVKLYCKDDISLIENYDKAIADKTQTWQCHHRRETIYSKKDLIEIGEYYDRPAIELIFLTKKEHKALHNTLFFKGRKFSLERNHKMSESLKGKTHSEESKKRMSVAQKNKKLSKEHKQRISESLKGRKLKPFSEEHKRKISEARKLYWQKRKQLCES